MAVAVGVARFAGVMLAVLAVAELLAGIALIADDGTLLERSEETLAVDATRPPTST